MREFGTNHNEFDNMNQNNTPDNQTTEEIKNNEAQESAADENTGAQPETVQNNPVPNSNQHNPYFQGYASQQPPQPDYRAQQHQREYPYQPLNNHQTMKDRLSLTDVL